MPYDAAYFAGHLGEPYHRGNQRWTDFFANVADEIVRQLHPATVLDAGCAIGFLVEALRDRGVDAVGFDVSDYAISQLPAELEPHCWVASVTDEIDGHYDLITCIEVLEHLTVEQGEQAIGNFARHTDVVLFSSTPDDTDEPTHTNVQPAEYWIERFGRHGFFRDPEIDAGFVSPHAVVLRRAEQTSAQLAASYEGLYRRARTAESELYTQLQTLQRESRDLQEELEIERAAHREVQAELEFERAVHREAQAELSAARVSLAEWQEWQQRSGVRMFEQLAALRRAVAPPGTRRDRIVRAALMYAADAAERVTGSAHGGSQAAEVLPPELGSVLYLSGCPGDAKRYRCDHHAEQLGLLGVTSSVAVYGEDDLGELVDRYRCVVLHRVPWGPDVAGFVQRLREHHAAVIFDTDDLVFDPAAAHEVAALALMDDDEKALYLDGLTRYRQTLERCDGATVSTDALRDAAVEVVENVEVVYNALSEEMLQHAVSALVDREDRLADSSDDRAPVVAYLSGTRTHNADFLQAADAVLWALRTFPGVRFRAVGHLDLDSRFDEFGERVERIPLQPWQALPQLLAEVDVNLAPLEPDNRFTDAKSCLKYVEAGVVGVPTIASPRQDFRRAIEHGRNGLLADTADEWRQTLGELLRSPARRRELGVAARDDVRGHHTGRVRSRELHRAIASILPPQSGSPLVVNWILRAPIAQRGGGYRTIFRLANALGARSHQVRVYVERIAHLDTMSPREIHAFVEEHFGPLEVDVVVGHEDIAEADLTFATNWPTAYVVAQHRRSLAKAYFIQDFEPEFYDRGSREAREAERTYRLPLRHVCYGHHLAETIQVRTGRPADSLDFALEPAFRVTTPPAGRDGPPRILFYARPDQARRGFDLGIEALRQVARSHPDARIAFFGAHDKELPDVGFAYENLGVLSEEELAAALNRSHIFVGFSLTNISHAPFEAMASGCAVVEADLESVRGMLPRDACVFARPAPDAVAAAVRGLIDDNERRIALANRAAAAVSRLSWMRTADQLEAFLEEACLVRLLRRASGRETRQGPR